MSRDQIIIGPDGQAVVIGTGAGNMRALVPEAGRAVIRDPIAKAPVLHGPHGRAWLCDLAKGAKIMKLAPGQDATLAHWVIEAPDAHPVWHSYSLIVIHLRPMPDNRPTMFYIDGATHEMWLYAIDPDKDRNELLSTGIVQRHWMWPCNFAAQFIEIGDDLARERIQNAAMRICLGELNPDTDGRSQWEAQFGSNMMKDRPNRRPPVVR